MSERPIRVLHLLNSFSTWGCGIVNAVLDIVSGQVREGLDVAVCSGPGELISVLESCDQVRATIEGAQDRRTPP